MKHKRLFTTAMLALLFAGLIIGGASAAIALGAGDTNAPQGPPDLDGTSWTLRQLDDKVLAPGGKATLIFEDGQVRGNATCNLFAGPYARDGERLSFGPLAMTMMACEGMDQETSYVVALGSVTGYRIAGEELLLVDADGRAVLVFEPERPHSLTGTAWQLAALSDGTAMAGLLEGTRITATFGDGRVTGSAGCNSYFASFSVDTNQIAIGPAGSTEMYCAEPEGVMEQEQAYLAALGTIGGYAIEGGKLALLDASGNSVLEFVAADN